MSRRLTIVEPGTGEALSIGAMTSLAGRAEWLSGAYCVMDQRLDPGRIAPVHTHDLEDQVAWVLDGTLTIWVDGDEAAVPASGFALRPKGLPHSMWNATATQAHFLEITSPATRFQASMRRLSELIDSGESSPQTVTALAAENGIEFHPELTAELVERTGLSTDGGFWRAGAES